MIIFPFLGNFWFPLELINWQIWLLFWWYSENVVGEIVPPLPQDTRALIPQTVNVTL